MSVTCHLLRRDIRNVSGVTTALREKLLLLDQNLVSLFMRVAPVEKN